MVPRSSGGHIKGEPSTTLVPVDTRQLYLCINKCTFINTQSKSIKRKLGRKSRLGRPIPAWQCDPHSATRAAQWAGSAILIPNTCRAWVGGRGKSARTGQAAAARGRRQCAPRPRQRVAVHEVGEHVGARRRLRACTRARRMMVICSLQSGCSSRDGTVPSQKSRRKSPLFDSLPSQKSASGRRLCRFLITRRPRVRRRGPL